MSFKEYQAIAVTMPLPVRILCVCMCNVCRSPAAEAVLRRLVSDNNLSDVIEIASAGTHSYRVGQASDTRFQRVTWARGYDLSQARARKIGWQDFEYFDILLAMDKSNLYDLCRNATEEQQGKIKLFMNYAKNFEQDEIPDPYTTLGQSVEQILDMIEDAANGVVEMLKFELSGGDKK